MKKVKIKTPCAGANFSYSAGEVLQLEDARANDLIGAGYAEIYRGGEKAPNTSRKPRAEKASQ